MPVMRKEGYHALDRGFLQAVEPGEYGGGERGSYGKEAGAVRRREREREREREGPKAVEGRTLGGSWKKSGMEAEEKGGQG